MSPIFPNPGSARAACYGVRDCRWRRSPPTPAPFPMKCSAACGNACRTRRSEAPSALEEPHLDPGQLDHIVVAEPGGLRTDRIAIEQREVVGLLAVHVDDEVAVLAVGDGGDLNAGPTQGGQRLVQFQLTTGEGARKHLQL